MMLSRQGRGAGGRADLWTRSAAGGALAATAGAMDDLAPRSVTAACPADGCSLPGQDRHEIHRQRRDGLWPGDRQSRSNKARGKAAIGRRRGRSRRPREAMKFTGSGEALARSAKIAGIRIGFGALERGVDLGLIVVSALALRKMSVRALMKKSAPTAPAPRRCGRPGQWCRADLLADYLDPRNCSRSRRSRRAAPCWPRRPPAPPHRRLRSRSTTGASPRPPPPKLHWRGPCRSAAPSASVKVRAGDRGAACGDGLGAGWPPPGAAQRPRR